MGIGTRWGYIISIATMFGLLIVGIWIGSRRDPNAHYKDVELLVRTTEETCWITGSGARGPDGRPDGSGPCGSGTVDLSDDATLPTSSIAVTKTTDNESELYAEFIVDGEVTDSGSTSAYLGTIYLSGT